MTLPQTIEKMRGAKGSKVRLTIVRADKAPVEFTIARDIIRVNSVNNHLDKDNIGYIRITRFQDDTAEELKRAVLDIKAKFAADQQKAFVLDLRNNPGGLLDQAVKVAGMFLEGERSFQFGIETTPRCKSTGRFPATCLAAVL